MVNEELKALADYIDNWTESVLMNVPYSAEVIAEAFKDVARRWEEEDYTG